MGLGLFLLDAGETLNPGSSGPRVQQLFQMECQGHGWNAFPGNTLFSGRDRMAHFRQPFSLKDLMRWSAKQATVSGTGDFAVCSTISDIGSTGNPFSGPSVVRSDGTLL